MSTSSPTTAQDLTHLLTEEDVAARIRTTVASVRWMRRTGRLTYIKIAGNRKVRFRWSQVLEDLRASEVPAAPRGDKRASQLADVTGTGDEDNAECAAADMAREFQDSAD